MVFWLVFLCSLTSVFLSISWLVLDNLGGSMICSLFWSSGCVMAVMSRWMSLACCPNLRWLVPISMSMWSYSLMSSLYSCICWLSSLRLNVVLSLYDVVGLL